MLRMGPCPVVHYDINRKGVQHDLFGLSGNQTAGRPRDQTGGDQIDMSAPLPLLPDEIVDLIYCWVRTDLRRRMLLTDVHAAAKVRITRNYGRWLAYWYGSIIGEDMSFHDGMLCAWDLYNKSEEYIEIIPRSVRKNAETVWTRAPFATFGGVGSIDVRFV